MSVRGDDPAAANLAAFIHRQKVGDDGYSSYDPRPDIESVLAALASAREENSEMRERLSHIRPLTDAEWQSILREHDVVAEARNLSRAVGEINTTADLDRALKRYGEAADLSIREANQGATCAHFGRGRR